MTLEADAPRRASWRHVLLGVAYVALLVCVFWFDLGGPAWAQGLLYAFVVLLAPLLLGVLLARWWAFFVPLVALVPVLVVLLMDGPPSDSEYGYGVIVLFFMFAVAPACMACSVGVLLSRPLRRALGGLR